MSKGGVMRVFDAVYATVKGDQVTIPVAARSLVHAARKAALQESDKGELVSVTRTDRIII